MSFLDNFKMAVGLKKPTEKYIQTTANTLRKTQGDARADRYLTDMKAKGNLKGSSSTKTKPTTTKTSKSSAKAGAQYAASMKKANELAKAGKLRRPDTFKMVDSDPIGFGSGSKKKVRVPGKLLSDARPIRNLAASPSISMEEAKAAGANIGTGYDPKTKTGYTDTAGQGLGTGFTLSGNKDDQGNVTGTTFTDATDIMTTGPSKYGLQNTLIGKGLSYLAGVRGDDKIVNTVGGKPIFQRGDGSFYAFDALGLPYDIADPEVGTAPSTLDIDPAVRERQLAMMNVGSTDDDDRSVATEVVGKQPDDPCPKGYMMDPETKSCVLDPFQQDFADAPDLIGRPVPTPVLSPYTQMAPVTLGQLQPTRVAAANPLAMQQANMPPQGGLGSLAPVLNRTS